MNIKYWIIFILILGAVCSLWSQEYYNNIIPFEFGNPNPHKVLYFNDGLVISVIYTNTDNNVETTTFISLDSSLNSTQYANTEGYFVTQKDPIYHNGNFYAFANHKVDPKMVSFIKYDSGFNITSAIDYNTPSGDNFAVNSVVLDNHLFGLSVDDFDRFGDWQRQINLEKIDLNGSEIWSINLAQEDRLTLSWESSATIDDNLLISTGVSRYDSSGRFADLRKMDPDGEIIWHAKGHEKLSNGAIPTWITTLSDSNIVQTYEIDKRQDLAWVTAREHYPLPPRLLWYDKNGNPFMDTLILTPWFDVTRVDQIEEGLGDYFFGYGSYEKDVDRDDILTNNGLLFKMNNEGEMLWSKRYRHPDYGGKEGQNVINDIVELDNGDIIILGRVQFVGGPSEIWLMRVNEYGCLGEESCSEEVITSNIEVVSEKSDVKIYPNPTDGEFYLSLDEAQHIIRVEVYDMQGQLILRVNGVDIDFVDLTGRQSGVYQLKIFLDKNRIVNARVINQ